MESEKDSKCFSRFLQDRPTSFGLRFVGEDSADGADSVSFPFLCRDDTHPLLRAVPVHIISPDRRPVVERLLWMQRDDLPMAALEALGFAGSREVERQWEVLLETLSKSSESSALTPMTPSSDTAPGVAPFYPLYWCRLRREFFEPPCPRCGNLLDLCRDDAFLEARGLPLFSLSFHRFLHCPQCAGSATDSKLYCRERSSGLPDFVGAHETLVEDWAHLLHTADPDVFPCRDCPENHRCYGQVGERHRHLLPVSFYPFRAFMSPPVDLTLDEFSKVVAGAPFAGVADEARRRGHMTRSGTLREFHYAFSRKPFLQNRSKNYRFIEILIVKIRLFLDVLDRISDSPFFVRPGKDISSFFWITLQQPASFGIPGAWGFQVHFIPFPERAGTGKSEPAVHGGLPFREALADLWIRLLLGRENIEKVPDESLKKHFFSAFTEPSEHRDAVLDPSWIFWDDDPWSPPPWILDLWKRVLETTREVFFPIEETLETSVQSAASRVQDRMVQLLHEIQERISGSFPAPHHEPAETEPDRPDHSELVRILLSILERWKEKVPPEPETIAETETIILTPERASTRIEKKEELEDDLDPTLIMGGGSGIRQSSPERVPDEPQSLEETLVLGTMGSPAKDLGPEPKQIDQPQADEGLESTIIVTASEEDREAPSKGRTEEEELEATIIQKKD